MISNVSTLNPLAINEVYRLVVERFSQAYDVYITYASHLFYLLSVTEIVLFALVFTFRHEPLVGPFILKLMKLGFIFFLIQAYPYLLKALIDGFTQVALGTHSKVAAKLFFNPALVWKYGFDPAIQLLVLSVQSASTNVGLTFLYFFLGLSDIVLFALISAEIVVLTAGFYIISLLSLLLIPFGVLSIGKRLFERSIQGVMSMGARIFAFILVIGIAVTIWEKNISIQINQSTKIDVLLGFFTINLVIFILSVKLPKLAGQAVGSLNSVLSESSAGTSGGHGTTEQTSVAVAGYSASAAQGSGSVSAGASASPLAAMQAATSMGASGGVGVGNSINVSAGGAAQGAFSFATGDEKSLKNAQAVRSLSPESMQKIKSTFRQLIKEQSKS